MVEVFYSGLLVVATLGAAWVGGYVVYRLVKGQG
jgi:hypothetical protein